MEIENLTKELAQFEKEVVTFVTPDSIVIFTDYRDGKLEYPVGNGDALMTVEYRGYKNMYIFKDKTESDKMICVEEVYRREVLNDFDGGVFPNKHKYATTDIDRFRSLQELTRNGYGSYKKI